MAGNNLGFHDDPEHTGRPGSIHKHNPRADEMLAESDLGRAGFEAEF